MLDRAPSIYKLSELVKAGDNVAFINYNWVPARPSGCFSLVHRLKAAWMVFTGSADVVTWDGQ